MGHRRGEGGDRDKKGFRIAPSRLRTYVYCPRLYFFETHMPRRKGLLERLRLAVGRLFHGVTGLIDRAAGFRVEDKVELEIGGYRVLGRPDSWRIDDGRLVVVERKSGRGPRGGVWLSDLIQATTYALALAMREKAVDVKVEVKYGMGGGGAVGVDEDLVYMVVRAMEEVRLVHEGIVPYPNRSPARCSICPYRQPCTVIDEVLEGEIEQEKLFEPGSWLASVGPVYRRGKD